MRFKMLKKRNTPHCGNGKKLGAKGHFLLKMGERKRGGRHSDEKNCNMSPITVGARRSIKKSGVTCVSPESELRLGGKKKKKTEKG